MRIVDTGIWACKHSYALALHPEAIQALEELGLAGRVLDGAYPVNRVALYDGFHQRACIDLGALPGSRPLAVVRQDLLEEALEDALKQHDVPVNWRHEIFAIEPGTDAVRVTVNKLDRESRGYVIAHSEWVVAESRTYEVPFVLGADGHRSVARNSLKIDFPEVGPAEYFAVFEFHSPFDLNHESRIVFHNGTTNALWPLPGSGCRWSFQLTDYHDTESEVLKDRLLQAGFGYFPTERGKDRSLSAGGSYHIPVLSDERLRQLVSERAPWFNAAMEDVTWRTVVRFERRLASSFGQGRIWLAGDAAHLTGPVGIQSMNLGLLEARDYAAAMAAVIRKGAPAGILAECGAKWMAVWRQLHAFDGGLKPADGLDSWLKELGTALLPCLPGHGESLAAQAAQIGFQAGSCGAARNVAIG